MLGALITFLFGLGVFGVCRWALGAYIKDFDPAERIGVLGLLGLGLVGVETLLIGLIPGGLNWGVWLEGAAALLGLAVLAKGWKGDPIRFSMPKDWRLAIVAGLALAFLIALVGAVGPSDMNDWDTLAYHLAVPKIWLAAGQITEIPYIHHSNFPFALDHLYIWGLKWGGMSGAKAFSTMIYGLGMLTLFGMARRRAGEKAGWIAALAFAGIPCALWESGTAYVDVGHGLFAGLGMLYAAEFVEGRNAVTAWQAAVMLALGCATKYTGLQTLFAAGLVVLGASFLFRRVRGGLSGDTGPRPQDDKKASSGHPQSANQNPKSALGAVALMVLAAAVLAGPWYVKNFFWTGNPVYPFFYEQIGSRNWDAFSAKIYKEEQQTFGVGRFSVQQTDGQWTSAPILDGEGKPTFRKADLGVAILGLGLQPGRYVNPAQTLGGGMPTGALGMAVVATWLAWLLSGRIRRFEGAILAMTGISLLMWFVLSQQSRYLVTLGIPSAVLAGAALSRLRAGPMLAVIVGLQAGWSLYVGKVFHLDPKLPVVLGRQTAVDYETQAVPFSEAAKSINEVVSPAGKVALFDEVFGYFLDVPYFWANPGHSTLIPWDRIQNGSELADELRKLGFTHAYLSLGLTSREQRDRWLAAAGLAEAPKPYSDEERKAAFGDLRNKWRVVLAESVAAGQLRPIRQFRSGILFEIS